MKIARLESTFHGDFNPDFGPARRRTQEKRVGKLRGDANSVKHALVSDVERSVLYVYTLPSTEHHSSIPATA